MFQKHIHKVKSYPSADDFAQAPLVMLVTNIMSAMQHFGPVPCNGLWGDQATTWWGTIAASKKKGIILDVWQMAGLGFWRNRVQPEFAWGAQYLNVGRAEGLGFWRNEILMSELVLILPLHGSWKSRASAWRNQIRQIFHPKYAFRDRYLSLNINLLSPVVEAVYMPENLVPFTPCMCQIVHALGILT